ncbi:hypothetical protein [Fonticella tunisiensis]|uniref:Uncharacterized protein n=1 Tax=Fonticella tunisiensis TaxID=1096341 RepID=A0A4R7K574_9CLOT|nr:hypothetical protein [Fonticella tunisiensis]TDT46001.1 hypothetical protein EDD71_1414 [Fonticella tunisiensis]
MDEKNKEILKRIKMNLEVGEELAEFKHQLNSMQNTLNQLKSASPNKQPEQNLEEQTHWIQTSDTLLQEIQNFKNQAQMQLQQTEQKLQQSIQQAMNVLNQASQQLQADQVFTQMNQMMNQAQNQLNQVMQQNQQS